MLPVLLLFVVPLVSAEDTFIMSGSSDSVQEGIQVNAGENVFINETLSMNKTIDKNHTDGHTLSMYGQYAVVTKDDGTIIDSQNTTELNESSYNFVFDHTFDEPGEYAFGARISSVEQVYEDGNWSETVENKTFRKNITVNYPEPPNAEENIESILTSLWDNFIDWLTGLF